MDQAVSAIRDAMDRVSRDPDINLDADLQATYVSLLILHTSIGGGKIREFAAYCTAFAERKAAEQILNG